MALLCFPVTIGEEVETSSGEEEESEEELEGSTEKEKEKEPYVANIRTEDGYVTVPRKQRRANRMGGYLASRRPAKIPVLAGEICGTLKLRHNIIRDTSANRLVIQTEASRLVQARRQNGDRMFKNLRDNDLAIVASFAAKMYWVPAQWELDMMDMFEDKPVVDAQADRSSWAVGPSSQ